MTFNHFYQLIYSLLTTCYLVQASQNGISTSARPYSPAKNKIYQLMKNFNLEELVLEKETPIPLRLVNILPKFATLDTNLAYCCIERFPQSARIPMEKLDVR